MEITALHDCTARAGATFTDFAGWHMPLRYSGDRAEHEAVRHRAGLFDLSHMAQLEIDGPSAGIALNASLATAPTRLAIGQAHYSVMLTPDGGIIDDVIVYRLAESSYLVVANAANREVVRDELTARSRAMLRSQGLSESVTVVDTTLHRSMVAIQGPASQEIVSRVLPPELAAQMSGLRYYRILEGTLGTIPVRIARTGYTGEQGYELMVPAEAAEEIWTAVSEAGAADGLIPCGLAARDTLRLEAGMRLYGHEMTRETSPYDCGLGGLVGDHHFVGKGALEKSVQQWHFCGLVGEGRKAARAGSQIYADGENIGEITSGVLSPTLGYPIALGRVRPEFENRRSVEVDVRGKRIPMAIVTPPFYRRRSSK